MISTGALIILATQGFTLLAALVSVLQAFRNKAAIQEVHFMVNSRLTELLTATKEASHAVGKAEGVAQQKADTDVKAASGMGS
jgi:hypothetical protein